MGLAFGLSMGTGIWGMHFIGMMAFFLPVPVYYDLKLTVLAAIVMGGDEFIILLEMIDDETDVVKEIGERVLSYLKRPFEINGQRVKIGASIGVGKFWCS